MYKLIKKIRIYYKSNKMNEKKDYTVDVLCKNCCKGGKMKIEWGIAVDEAFCNHCGTKGSLVRNTEFNFLLFCSKLGI